MPENYPLVGIWNIDIHIHYILCIYIMSTQTDVYVLFIYVYNMDVNWSLKFFQSVLPSIFSAHPFVGDSLEITVSLSRFQKEGRPQLCTCVLVVRSIILCITIEIAVKSCPTAPWTVHRDQHTELSPGKKKCSLIGLWKGGKNKFPHPI